MGQCVHGGVECVGGGQFAGVEMAVQGARGGEAVERARERSSPDVIISELETVNYKSTK